MFNYYALTLLWLMVTVQCTLSHEKIDLCPRINDLSELCNSPGRIIINQISQQIANALEQQAEGEEDIYRGKELFSSVNYTVIDGRIKAKFREMEARISTKLDELMLESREPTEEEIEAKSRQFNARLQETERGIEEKFARFYKIEEERRRVRPISCVEVCGEVINGTRPDSPVGFATSGTAATIYPTFEDDRGIEVYCQCTNLPEEAWTVFQRRMDGSVDFYRNYREYEDGFGNSSGEYWLGLKYTSLLTARPESYELRIDLRSFPYQWGPTVKYAEYDSFSVSDCSLNYTLTVDGYSGTLGNSFSGHDGAKFSTYDVNNIARGNDECAKTYHGAWWFIPGCFSSHLNGKYYQEKQNPRSHGIVWGYWKGFSYSMMASEMKFRKKMQ